MYKWERTFSLSCCANMKKLITKDHGKKNDEKKSNERRASKNTWWKKRTTAIRTTINANAFDAQHTTIRKTIHANKTKLTKCVWLSSITTTKLQLCLFFVIIRSSPNLSACRCFFYHSFCQPKILWSISIHFAPCLLVASINVLFLRRCCCFANFAFV